jgi:hypothetical protein
VGSSKCLPPRRGCLKRTVTGRRPSAGVWLKRGAKLVRPESSVPTSVPTERRALPALRFCRSPCAAAGTPPHRQIRDAAFQGGSRCAGVTSRPLLTVPLLVARVPKVRDRGTTSSRAVPRAARAPWCRFRVGESRLYLSAKSFDVQVDTTSCDKRSDLPSNVCPGSLIPSDGIEWATILSAGLVRAPANRVVWRCSRQWHSSLGDDHSPPRH